MSGRYFLRTRISKKGNTVWELTDKRGKIIASNIHREKVIEFINKKIRLLESWPNPPRKIDTEKDEKTVEHIVSWRQPWQSVNFVIAKWRGLLQTEDIAGYLGVSESWVRNNLKFTEWHHSYKQKGDYGKAFFYDPEDVIAQLAENQEKLDRLLKLSYKHYAELCSLTGKAPDINNLGWYRRVKEYQNVFLKHQKEAGTV